MKKAEKLIKELEEELTEYIKQTQGMDLNSVQHPALWFARMSFYQAQAFKKVFERLDEIEENLSKKAGRR